VRYFKILISCGHVGSTKEITIARFFIAKNIVEAFESGNKMPRAKRKHNHTAVLMVKPITKNEYLAGKDMEKQNRYLFVE